MTSDEIRALMLKTMSDLDSLRKGTWVPYGKMTPMERAEYWTGQEYANGRGPIEVYTMTEKCGNIVIAESPNDVATLHADHRKSCEHCRPRRA